MPPYQGRGSAAGLARQTAFDTPVSPPTHWLQLTNIGKGEDEKSYVENPVLVDQPTKATPVLARSRYSASITTAFSLDGHGEWLYQALGSASHGGGGGPTYTSTYTLATSLPDYGFTFYLNRGTAPESDIVTGCKIGRFRWYVKIDDYAYMDLDIVGVTNNNAAKSTPSYTATRSRVAAWNAGDLTWNGSTYCLREFEVTVDNGLDEPIFMSCAIEFVRSYAKVTGKFVVAYDAEDFRDDLRAGTVSDVDITFTSGSHSVRHLIENALIKKVSAPVQDGGIIYLTVEFEGYSDIASGGSDTGYQIIVVNGNSTSAVSN